MREAPDHEFLALQEALAGRYSLERELGRGGMGVVYLAREVRLDRPVALKMLPAQYAARQALRARFLREARTAARLSHPHIVPIHAVDEVGDFVYMVMAYVEGQTLEQRIRERGPLPVMEAARLLREVAWALAYAHAQGVVHRDIKPANILLETGSGRALVTDFGIAHVSEDGSSGGEAEVIGTAEYMSPEQAAGAGVDGRSDLYALGVVAYEMLSGRLPFEGATVAETLARQMTQAAAPLASVVPELPAPLTQAVDRCLAKDPAARFTGGEELAEALSRALERRREMPAALRVFNERVQHVSRSLVALGATSSLFLAVGVYVGVTGAPFNVAVGNAIASLLFAITPLGMLVHTARGLLRSGYRHDELLRALRLELEERRQALGGEPPAVPGRWDRLIGRFGVGSLIVYGAGLGYMLFGTYFPAFETVFLPIMGAAGIGSLLAGLMTAAKHALRGRPPGERWLKFWDSRIGRAVFKLAGLRLERLPCVGASYRPTELAIGLAVDRLYEELPTEVRNSLAELPAVVRSLEQHAEKMRARIAELNAILPDVESAATSDGQSVLSRAESVAQKRSTLAENVHATRDAAEQRLAEVVAALETVRLQLLRMHAGVGSLQRLTADLSSARELSCDMGRLLEGAREVDQLLGLEWRPVGATPAPA